MALVDAEIAAGEAFGGEAGGEEVGEEFRVEQGEEIERIDAALAGGKDLDAESEAAIVPRGFEALRHAGDDDFRRSEEALLFGREFGRYERQPRLGVGAVQITDVAESDCVAVDVAAGNKIGGVRGVRLPGVIQIEQAAGDSLG